MQTNDIVRLHAKDQRGFDGSCEALSDASTIDDVRLCEAKAAAWNAWSNVRIRFTGREQTRALRVLREAVAACRIIERDSLAKSRNTIPSVAGLNLVP